MKQLYSKHFPTPKLLGMFSYSMDISDHSIKYGELKMSPSGLRLGKYGREKIDSGIIKSGRIEDPEELISILSRLKEKENMEFVRVALPEEQIYLFTLSIVKIEEGDLRDTILLQLEDHIPLSAKSTLFDYEILSETETHVTLEVVAISSEVVDDYLFVFERAGLVPISFELEAQSIAEAVVPLDEIGTTMIIDFGETRTGISIAVNRKIVFTSTFDIGGDTFTEMISKHYHISIEEAEKKKYAFGELGLESGEDIFPAVLNVVAVLRDELNKHFVYWATHKSESGKSRNPISKIILCGGGSNIPGLASYLSVSFKTRVEYANAWTNISNMDESVPYMSAKESLSYVTVLGLALGDYIYD